MMNDAANRAISIMSDWLIAYQASDDIDALDQLVGQLSGGIDTLVGHVNEEWLGELRSAWWPLEYVNATVLGSDRGHLTDEEVMAVSKAREEFVALLQRY
jgi:hypothetical protein